MNRSFIRKLTETYVNNWCKKQGCERATVACYYNLNDQNKCTIWLIDETLHNSLKIDFDVRVDSEPDGWLRKVLPVLEQLYSLGSTAVDNTVVTHPSKSNYLFSYEMVSPAGIASILIGPELLPTKTVTAKYFFNGLTFEFTKDELLKLCVDTRAVNAFINELVGRALAKE